MVLIYRAFALSMLVALLATATTFAQSYTQTQAGVSVKPLSGDAKEVRLEVLNDRIIRVTAVPKEGQVLKESLMRVAPQAKHPFHITADKTKLVLKTAKISAEVMLKTGTVRFKKASGETVLVEEGRGHIKPVTIDGPSITPTDSYVSVSQQFNKGTSEAFFGLGQQQNGVVNYNGQDALLMQHNMHIAMPFVVSSKNYGLLWDNNSITRWGNPKPYGLLGRDLTLFDKDGKMGGLTATYFVAGEQKLSRFEPNIDYQYGSDVWKNWPSELRKLPDQKVIWEGSFTTKKDGEHKFQLYSSGYAKLYIDDKLVKDVWRQNWNAWYHTFDVALKKNKTYRFRLEWITEDGYLTVLHNEPMPAQDRQSMMWHSEVGEAIDYYFIDGDSPDEVISGYRTITGKAPLLPKSAYGFWQSRQRYKTQDEHVGVVEEYRKRQIPLDNIVVDWFYWPENAWGSHDFDKDRFPNPKKMVDDVHRLNAKIMISVWGKFYTTTDNYKELDAKGFIYRRNVEQKAKDWVGPGYLNSHYDPYAKEARDIYWRQIKDKLNGLGFDAWWLDNTEPEIISNIPVEEQKLRIGPTHFGPGAAVFNPYSLMTTKAVYEGERQTDPDKRPMIMTRSGFPGLQRHASAVWSGDTVARWDNLENQIAAGIGISLSGIPNWSHDIGGFSTEKRYNAQPMTSQDQAEWRELNQRWFQFGAFSPIFRSHGEFPFREIYNLGEDGSDIQNNLIWYTKLRYRLLPYIYSVAAKIHHSDGTIMRGLGMDFGQDPKVHSIHDQYMFGQDLMVAPVTRYKARSRSVYLPKKAVWLDFYSGQTFEGGRTIDVHAPLSQIPLFVRAGAIIPTTVVQQFVDEKPDAPLTLLVFEGADGQFTLYDDDGVSNAYERGKFAKILLQYHDKSGVLTIGARNGTYDKMPLRREIRVRFIKAGMSASENLDAYDASIMYEGAMVSLKRN